MYIVVSSSKSGMIPWNEAIVARNLPVLKTMKLTGRFRCWLAPECFGVEGDRLVRMLTEFHREFVWPDKPISGDN